MGRLSRRIRYLLTLRRREAELLEELEAHRAMKQAELERRGLPAHDARAASRRQMGNLTLALEDAASTWIPSAADALRQDASYALRQLRRQPAFACFAIGTLALAIGLNTSLFTVFNALAIRPWPVGDPDRVITLFNMSGRDLRERAAGGPLGFSLEEAAYFRAHARTIAGVVATRSGGGDQTLGESDTPVSWVSGTYFGVLHIPMAQGRGFTPEEDRDPASSAVAVLSHAYWQRQFGGDPGVIGRQVRFEDVPFTIVGVTQPEFTGTQPERIDVWMPMASASLLRPDDRWVRNVAMNAANCCVALAARLDPAATRQEAQAELALLDRQFRNDRRIASPEDGVTVRGTQFSAGPNGSARETFLPMFAAVMLVLLLACANVGNLLTARAVVRRREIAIRLSVGASRGRVMRQLLTEGVVLATAAGTVGLWIACWLPAYLVAVSGAPAALHLAPDAAVVAYTLGISAVSCLVFALAPAVHGIRAAVTTVLKDGGPSGSSRLHLRNALLAVQVAAVVVLLCGAGVLARAVFAAQLRDYGFDLERLSAASIEIPPRGFDAARVRAASLQLAADLAPFDGSRVALTSTPPLGTGNIKGSFAIAASPDPQFNSVYEVSPGYFDLAGTPLIAGRAFTAADSGRPVIVVNETMARRYWNVRDAIGQRIVCDGGGRGWNMQGALEIIGVVRDAYLSSLSDVDATVYQPLSGRTIPHILFRTADADAASIAASAAGKVDPRLRERVRPLSDNLAPRLRPSRTAAMLAGSLGMLALLLAAVGLFGVFAWWVQQRTREIGIRMALGARGPQVVRLVLRSSGASMVAGLVLGAAGTAGSSALLDSYLLGASRIDPLTYAGVAVILSLAVAAATYVPARRATQIDPLLALRCD